MELVDLEIPWKNKHVRIAKKRNTRQTKNEGGLLLLGIKT